MNYQLAKSSLRDEYAITLLRDDGTILGIPPDPANTDYTAYLAWLEEGNEPLLPEQAPLTWDDIRAKRNQLIRESDWTMVQDATVNQAAWAQYRQILRDLPQTYASVTPGEVVWPEPPLAAGPNTVTEIE